MTENWLPIRQSVTSDGPISSKLTTDYDKNRLINNINFKLSISVHYKGL
jgi:hypothetical protein